MMAGPYLCAKTFQRGIPASWVPRLGGSRLRQVEQVEPSRSPWLGWLSGLPQRSFHVTRLGSGPSDDPRACGLGAGGGGVDGADHPHVEEVGRHGPEPGRSEAVNDQLKNVCQIEHTRHRCPLHFVMHLLGGLIAYAKQPQKPSLNLEVPRNDSPLVLA